VGPILALVAQSPEITQVIAEEETNNPILPTVNELFWALVLFCALWALMKFVLLPPITRGMEGRAAKVRGDLAAADAAKAAAAAQLAEYEAGLQGTRTEAVRIIEDARSEAEAERRQVVAAAEAEVAAQRAEAAREIAAAKARAKVELQGSLAGIAVGAAEAVMEKPLDRDAQTQVIEDYVNRAGSQS
jgi:F-type H+-transporting ATPase subunit b